MKSISLMTFVAGVALSALTGSAFAAGDPAAGEKVFAKCKACHQIGETAKNAIAPELNGIDGRAAGSADGYNYSDADEELGHHLERSLVQGIHQEPEGQGSRHENGVPGPALREGPGRCVGLSFGLWRRRQKEVTGATNAPDCESGPRGPLFLCEGA